MTWALVQSDGRRVVGDRRRSVMPDALREPYFGEQVVRRPAFAAEITAAGHRVGLHCFRHRNQMRLTRWQA